jgi:hypothetical protein
MANEAVAGGLLDGVANTSMFDTALQWALEHPSSVLGLANTGANIVGGALTEDPEDSGDYVHVPTGVPNWGRPNYPQPLYQANTGAWRPGLTFNQQAGLLAGGISPPPRFLTGR